MASPSLAPAKNSAPVKDESCRIDCPACGIRAKVDHTDDAGTWWKCVGGCGVLFSLHWPLYKAKAHVATITEQEGLT